MTYYYTMLCCQVPGIRGVFKFSISLHVTADCWNQQFPFSQTTYMVWLRFQQTTNPSLNIDSCSDELLWILHISEHYSFVVAGRTSVQPAVYYLHKWLNTLNRNKGCLALAPICLPFITRVASGYKVHLSEFHSLFSWKDF